ncbi:gamma-glutamyl-phosphate reductase, partial [Pseudoxanthomonas sp. SGD-10]
MENITHLLKSASKATTVVKNLSASKKEGILLQLADALVKNTERIILENKRDLERMDDADPKKDRLLLNPERINGLAAAIKEVAVLEDPT